MICSKCGKREASFFKPIIKDGVAVQMHLCIDCYNQLNAEEQEQNNNLNMNQFLNNSNSEVIVCKNCNTTSKQFLETSYLGCSECYEAFEEILKSIIKKIHKGGEHIGKFPINKQYDAPLVSKLVLLKQNLKEAVEREAFEEAIRIKEEISRLREEEL